MNEMLEKMGKNAKEAEVTLRSLSTNKKNEVLLAVAGQLEDKAELLIKANEQDVENGRKNQMPESLVDRLLLTKERIEGMSEGLRQLAELEDPIGEVLGMKKSVFALKQGTQLS